MPDYILSEFEAQSLQKILRTLSREYAYGQTKGYSDLVAIATSASALNALVSMIRANVKAQDASLRLDGALSRLDGCVTDTSKGPRE